jgi:hypothetical protein
MRLAIGLALFTALVIFVGGAAAQLVMTFLQFNGHARWLVVLQGACLLTAVVAGLYGLLAYAVPRWVERERRDESAVRQVGSWWKDGEGDL